MKLLVLAVLLAIAIAGCVSTPPQGENNSGKLYSNITTSIQEGSSLKAQKGDSVAVDYVGTFDDGTVFDTSLKDEAVKAKMPLRQDYAPIEFTAGAGQMIKGFDNAVYGMKEGDVKDVHLNASEAYGLRDETLVVTANRSQIQGNPKAGDQVSISSGARGVIVNVTASTVTVDFNPPMAGKNLNFKIIMRKITRS